MDDYEVKQKIQHACFEPRAPEDLVQKVILRTQAVSMGVQAQKQLETAPAENVEELASRALIGQLAVVSELPSDAQPEQLARTLEQEPAFIAALHGGNVARRLSSGELIRQVVGQEIKAEEPAPQIENPIKKGPSL